MTLQISWEYLWKIIQCIKNKDCSLMGTFHAMGINKNTISCTFGKNKTGKCSGLTCNYYHTLDPLLYKAESCSRNVITTGKGGNSYIRPPS